MKKLDSFTKAYIECALWSSTDDNGEPLDKNYSIDDLSQESIDSAIADCEDFQESQADLLQHDELDNYDSSTAGFDFWLTRNRHGTGFWDSGLGDIGRKLTDAAHVYGGVDLYVGDDGKIYGS